MSEAGGGQSVLIVEDDPSIRDFLSDFLELEGYGVLEAGNGEQALAMLRRQPLALVLTDLGLPGTDGWTLLREMKSDPALASVPVVVFTGSASDSERKRALEMGAVYCLRKPVGVTELRQVLSRLAPRQGGSR